jgi:hypothetical protein
MRQIKTNTAGLSLTVGTADFVISGRPATFRSIASQASAGQELQYKAKYSTGVAEDDYEEGWGVWNGASTLTRGTIESSSNGNAKVVWNGDEITIFIVATGAMLKDMDQMVEGTNTKILTAAERASISSSASGLFGHLADTSDAHDASAISFTPTGSIAATDVQAALVELDGTVGAVAGGMVYKGTWSAAGGTFPGAGGAQTGWLYYVSVAGSVNGVAFDVGDNILATVDNASTTTYAGNWSKHDQTDAVQSVNSKTGAAVLHTDDLSDAGRTNKWATAAEKTKLGFVTVTQAVNLDTIESTLGSITQFSMGTTTPVTTDGTVGNVFLNTSTGKLYVFTAD